MNQFQPPSPTWQKSLDPPLPPFAKFCVRISICTLHGSTTALFLAMSFKGIGKCILGDPGADSGGEGKSKQAEKYGTKKSKEQREEPLGTMSYQTSSKRSPPFWLLIGARKRFSGTNQNPERWRPFGTGLVRHCPQGLFSPFFTFLRAKFFRLFRLSLAPTICPWVSKDEGNALKDLCFLPLLLF